MGGWKKTAQSRTAQANLQAMCTEQDLKGNLGSRTSGVDQSR